MVGMDNFSLIIDDIGSWVLRSEDGLDIGKIAQDGGESIQN